MADKYFVGDEGTEIIVDCGQDITGAQNTALKIRKPDGTEEDWTPADIYQTNYLRYITVANNFDQTGNYRLQSYLEKGGWKGRGEVAFFHVYDHFKEQ